MLKRVLVLVSAALCLAACSELPPDTAPEGEAPLAIDAIYRLLFNGQLVGNALFEFELFEGGGYRIDALTAPAGQMAAQSADEVLESSRGSLDAETIQPARFEHSVMRAGQIELISVAFDWQRRRLRVQGGQAQRDVVLLPGTHDRLSYLLAAYRLAVAGDGAVQLQVATAEASEETILEVTGREPVALPSGHYEAVVVHRITPNLEESRQFWFDPALSPLPLRILHTHDGNRVDMQLEDLSRRPNDPR